jgi:hypothetical protein
MAGPVRGGLQVARTGEEVEDDAALSTNIYYFSLLLQILLLQYLCYGKTMRYYVIWADRVHA